MSDEELKAEALSALRYAKDIGSHGEAEAFAVLLRVLDTVPTAAQKILVMSCMVARMTATIEAMLGVIEEFSPRLAEVTRRAIQEAKAGAANG